MPDNWLSKINWTEDGLVPAIAQEAGSGKILMVAWMNREALRLTVEKREAVYWSRSRKKLWHKGEESGHTQTIKDIYLDCDEDVDHVQSMSFASIDDAFIFQEEEPMFVEIHVGKHEKVHNDVIHLGNLLNLARFVITE